LLLGELGLTGPVAEALTALVEDLDRFGAGGLVVPTDRGPTPVQGPSFASDRDMLLGYLLRGLARLSGAEGFAGLAEAAHLTAVRTDAPYLSAKLRVIAARGAVERGDMASALDVARRLGADREVWKAMAKWQRSELHRALAVIHVAAREFHVARTLSEGCDLGHRLFVYASLLRRYDGEWARPGDPAGGLGSGPSESAPFDEDPAD
jgi:hypothetical protein